MRNLIARRHGRESRLDTYHGAADGFGRACVAAVGAERGATIGASRAGTEPVERHAEQHCERARSLDSKDRVIKYKDALDNTH